jgi:hypothetical protein
VTTTITIELLYFEACPNHEAARKLVERVAHELGVKPEVRLVEIPDPEAAARMRFLGSPTIRVNGRDIEPSADERGEFVLACRVYRTAAGLRGEPAEAWVRDALLAAR